MQDSENPSLRTFTYRNDHSISPPNTHMHSFGFADLCYRAMSLKLKREPFVCQSMCMKSPGQHHFYCHNHMAFMQIMAYTSHGCVKLSHIKGNLNQNLGCIPEFKLHTYKTTNLQQRFNPPRGNNGEKQRHRAFQQFSESLPVQNRNERRGDPNEDFFLIKGVSCPSNTI